VLYLYHGPDSYSRTAALAELRARLDVDGMLSMNSTALDGRTVKPDELMATCDTVPFLAAARLVHVTGLLAAQEGRRRVGRAALRAAAKRTVTAEESPWLGFADYVERMPTSTALVLEDDEMRDGSPLLLELRRRLEGRDRDAPPLLEERSFPPLGQEAVQQWVRQRCRSLGAAIHPRAVATLAESVGSDLWRLNGEIEKLSLYGFGRTIEEADVRAMVPVEESATVFELVDAVVAGSGNAAVRLVRLLMDDGAAGPYLLTMLARQFRQLVLVQDLQRRGVPRQEIMSRVDIRSDFLLAKLMGQAQRYRSDRLRRTYERLLETDLSIKRGIQEEDAALELLVAEIAGLR